MSKYILLSFLLLLLSSCNKQDEEFVKFIETNEQGEIVGENIQEQWSPRTQAEQFEDISYPLSSKPAYPNPANIEGETTISFALNSDREVVIEILNKPGNVTDTLVNEIKEAGFHQINFRPRHAAIPPNHIYQIRITSSENEIFGNIKIVE